MNTAEQKQQSEWRESTVHIRFDLLGTPTSKEVPGKVLVGTGLGYWIGENANIPTFYLPTHLLSGHKAAPDPLYCEDICKKYLEAIAPLTDWNKSLQAVTSDEQAMEKVSKLFFDLWIEDASQSAGGGRW